MRLMKPTCWTWKWIIITQKKKKKEGTEDVDARDAQDENSRLCGLACWSVLSPNLPRLPSLEKRWTYMLEGKLLLVSWLFQLWIMCDSRKETFYFWHFFFVLLHSLSFFIILSVLSILSICSHRNHWKFTACLKWILEEAQVVVGMKWVYTAKHLEQHPACEKCLIHCSYYYYNYICFSTMMRIALIYICFMHPSTLPTTTNLTLHDMKKLNKRIGRDTWMDFPPFSPTGVIAGF